ncbi:hypothetical protein CMI37_09360 [Candidatus Pacearchaeota archaeon]|nr:hypothetical protein [Candidatus Pacearchaeota archaeon]|tara:strand:- start:2568 stop:2972 length:405 start_codon:yes stop_codon:yes gene_type:complete
MVQDMERFVKSILATLGVLLIDALIHAFYTHPFETWFYFVVKVLVVYILMYIMFGQEITFLRVVGFAAIFMVIFTIYYRLFELFNNFPIGYRAPDIVIFGRTFGSNVSKAIGWTIIHMSVFIASALSVEKIVGE